MINPHQQKTRQRKLIYAVLILGLFTLSLMHRRFVVEPAAYDLQLRETARGEVELTGSALRLTLTGSRGIAIAFLWHQAIETQKKHEWNELELLVGSISKLQPYFLTPWLFQSWNLSFNVAVECDRTRDKYYYVSRGIELLSEGERRNRGGEKFPGNPEMRHNIANTYLRKIGYSDEKQAMQSLLDMSMIDPLKRDPRKLMPTPGSVDLDEFAIFVRNNPRLVRRLHDRLRLREPAEIVRFLTENRDVPSQFETPDWNLAAGATESNMRPLIQQFPIVPPGERAPDYQGKSIDVFRIGRAWSEYSIDPLPPETNDPSDPRKYYDPLKHRLPKAMAIEIFRGYPARCETFFAEGLQEEGFFEGEGWQTPPRWFESKSNLREGLLVGTETKYDSRRSWEESARLNRDYGVKNGLYFSPAEVKQFNDEAQAYRKAYKVNEADRFGPKPAETTGPIAKGYEAHQKLVWNRQVRDMCNYDAHLYQSEGEAQPETIHARRLFFAAKRAKEEGADEEAIEYYAEAWPHWIAACLRYPTFAMLENVQEAAYETMFENMRLIGRSERAPMIQAAVLGVAELGLVPPLPLHKFGTTQDYFKFQPHKHSRGLLEWLQMPENDSPELRRGIAQWSAAAAMPAPLPGVATPIGVLDLWLVRSAPRKPLPPGWQYLLREEAVNVGRGRLMLPVHP
jgi:hypothetical protein